LGFEGNLHRVQHSRLDLVFFHSGILSDGPIGPPP
jgi:hypothetical protein